MARRSQIALSGGSVISPGDSVWVPDRPIDMPHDEVQRRVRFERIKRIETQPGTLADYIRQSLTLEDVRDPKAGVKRIKALVTKAQVGKPSRVAQVFRQLIAEGGVAI